MDNEAKFKDLNRRTGSLEELKKELRQSHILIQTTPIGMFRHIDKTLVPIDFLHDGLLVFDSVYNPLKTKLIKDAESKGSVTISRLEMFIGQACEQYKLFTGQKAYEKVMKKLQLRKSSRIKSDN